MVNLKSRKVIYTAVIAACFLSVGLRINTVNSVRRHPIISYYSQWQKYGKPVEVRPVGSREVPVYVRFTVRVLDGRLAAGFVTGDVKDALREGQEIYEEDVPVPCATIRNVGKELDIDTGMFPVQIIFNDDREPGAACVVSAHTRTLHNVLVVPNEVLEVSGEDYFIWKDNNGTAGKRKVTLGQRNGYGAVITSGLQSGDKVVFSGQSELKEGDRLMTAGSPPSGKKAGRE